MTALAVVLACLTGSPAPLPECPAQRVACKALRGDYGTLKPWQEKGYRALADGQPRFRMAVRTHYGPYEGRQGRVDAYGKPCTMRTLAANSIPRYSWVLLMEPHWELRQVLDCGAAGNDKRWTSRREGRGCEVWVDRWHPSPKLANVSGPVRIAVVR